MPETGSSLLRHEARLQFGAPIRGPNLEPQFGAPFRGQIGPPFQSPFWFQIFFSHPRLKACVISHETSSTGHTLHLACRPWSRQPILATAVCVLSRTNVNDSTKSATPTGEEQLPRVGKFCVRSSVSETCLKKVPFRCFCFGKGF